jgi:hypothetical protein
MADLRITIDVNTDGDAFACDAVNFMRRVFSDAENTVFQNEKFGRGTDAESILFDENGNRCGAVRLEYISEPKTVPLDHAADIALGTRPRRCECGARSVVCGECGAPGYACATVCGACGSDWAV